MGIGDTRAVALSGRRWDAWRRRAEGEMHRVSAWLDARSAPVVATVLFAIAGLGYALLWAALAHHGVALLQRPVEQRGARPRHRARPLVGRLRPAVAARRATGLRGPPGAGDGDRPRPRPRDHRAEGSSYKAFGLILAPVATVMAASVLFALDAVARRWRYSEARRVALALPRGSASSARRLLGPPRGLHRPRARGLGGAGSRSRRRRRPAPRRLAARPRHRLRAPGPAGGGTGGGAVRVA